MTRYNNRIAVFLLHLLVLPWSGRGFTTPSPRRRTIPSCHRRCRPVCTSLGMVAVGKKYVPKWKKKETIGGDDLDDREKGLVGTIPVTFHQGNVTRTTLAIVGQPLSDVATQAGQFIKYGCGRGECGTCEALCNGKWIRPCSTSVPAGEDGLVIRVKDVKAKAKSSGKFYSVRSFFMGFYNNLLGMVGFVKTRRAAKRNWQERQEYEDLIKRLTLEKKRAKAAKAAASSSSSGTAVATQNDGTKLRP